MPSCILSGSIETIQKGLMSAFLKVCDSGSLKSLHGDIVKDALSLILPSPRFVSYVNSLSEKTESVRYKSLSFKSDCVRTGRFMGDLAYRIVELPDKTFMAKVTVKVKTARRTNSQPPPQKDELEFSEILSPRWLLDNTCRSAVDFISVFNFPDKQETKDLVPFLTTGDFSKLEKMPDLLSQIKFAEEVLGKNPSMPPASPTHLGEVAKSFVSVAHARYTNVISSPTNKMAIFLDDFSREALGTEFGFKFLTRTFGDRLLFEALEKDDYRKFLSYTSFSVSDMELSPEDCVPGSQKLTAALLQKGLFNDFGGR